MAPGGIGVRWLGGLAGSLVVGSLLAGVVAIGIKQAEPQSAAVQTNATSTAKFEPTPYTATTTVLLGVPVPKGLSDKLYAVSLPDRHVAPLTVPKGWRLTALQERTPLKLQTNKDGSATLVGRYASSTDLAQKVWFVPVRTSSGKAYDEVSILGMFDPTHVAVAARADDRVALSISRVGDIRKVITLGDMIYPLGVSQGSLWVSTFQPGEGIESPPQGPSDLIRVSVAGATSTVATDEHVIVSALAGQDGCVAYATESGDLYAQSGSSTWRGLGLPLAWLDSGHLLFSQGISVYLLDLATSVEMLVNTLPAAPTVGAVSSTSIIF